MYPSSTYRDIGAALTWLGEAFGFEGQILDEVAAMLRHRNGTTLIQLDRPDELHGSHTGQTWVYVVTEDIDAHYRRAKTAGASLLGEPHDYGDGYRGYSARDLEGNLWSSAPGVTKPARSPASAASWACRPPRSSPSRTCPTTCPCLPGPARGMRWPTRTTQAPLWVSLAARADLGTSRPRASRYCRVSAAVRSRYRLGAASSRSSPRCAADAVDESGVLRVIGWYPGVSGSCAAGGRCCSVPVRSAGVR